MSFFIGLHFENLSFAIGLHFGILTCVTGLRFGIVRSFTQYIWQHQSLARVFILHRDYARAWLLYGC